jgi:hypothetical protein
LREWAGLYVLPITSFLLKYQSCVFKTVFCQQIILKQDNVFFICIFRYIRITNISLCERVLIQHYFFVLPELLTVCCRSSQYIVTSDSSYQKEFENQRCDVFTVNILTLFTFEKNEGNRKYGRFFLLKFYF